MVLFQVELAIKYIVLYINLHNTRENDKSSSDSHEIER